MMQFACGMIIIILKPAKARYTSNVVWYIREKCGREFEIAFMAGSVNGLLFNMYSAGLEDKNGFDFN